MAVTFDLSARNLHLFKYDHWLREPGNVVQLHLAGPAWETGQAASDQPANRTAEMRSWAVSEVERFLQARDLAGPAELARVSGVNGADLLMLSAEELSSEVRLSPFAARKVVAARGAYLRS